MPVVTGTNTPKVTTPPATGPANSLGCKAFQKDVTLSGIVAGKVEPLAKGAPKSEAVKTAQCALFSLGFLAKRNGVDGAFGPGTEAAVKAFQAKAGIEETGKLDATTLKALDKAGAAQISQLKSQTAPAGSKRDKYEIVADISNSGHTRLYVVGKDGKVAARYLTSPGRAEFPTQGTKFTVPDVMVRQPWNPPKSAWAANSKQVPPGIDNPMGIMKLSLGNYSQYIHGIPPSEEPELGKAASHGCLRMSGSNILELGEKYAEAGTNVTINRDARRGNELEAKFEETFGAQDRPTDAGREYMFGYVSGELGQGQHYSPK
ncbi:MAG TPA: L,D-transpeptidase family protein [Myxococcales bacterium]|jgi:lipoprotein-anchoring transpeptidase ErfK/SrfK